MALEGETKEPLLGASSAAVTDAGSFHGHYDRGVAKDSEESISVAKGVSVVWSHLALTIKQPQTPIQIARREPPSFKRIIDGVSGFARAGELLAILGGSGSGKTSLLNSLCNRYSGTLEGRVTFNGRTWGREELSNFSGYVMQDDSLLARLTVFETLLFSAELKYGSTYSKAKLKERVNRVIADLGLRAVRNSSVGSATIRGISGGERRRVSIGIQLLTDAEVLFIDEPTSGLDAFNALKTMQTLKSLAVAGHTVICTIHQPRSDIVQLFDSVLLMSNGRAAFFGPYAKLVPYLNSQGHPVPKYTNPLDFAVDLVTIDYSSEASAVDSKRKIDLFVKEYSDSELAREMLREGDERSAVESPLPTKPASVVSRQGASGFCRELGILTRRSVLVMARTRSEVAALSGQFLLIGVVIGTIFVGLTGDIVGIRDRFSLLYVSIALLPFGVVLSAVSKVCADRPMYHREHRDNMYGPIAYYISKTLSEVPFYALLTALYASAIYWPSGLQRNAGKAANFFLMLWLVVNCSVGLASFVSHTVMGFQSAQFVANLLYTFVVVPCGFVVNVSSMHSWIRWTGTISFLKNGFEGLMHNEFHGITLCPVRFEDGKCPFPEVPGQVAMSNFGIGDSDLASLQLYLLGIIAIFHVGGLLAILIVPQIPKS